MRHICKISFLSENGKYFHSGEGLSDWEFKNLPEEEQENFMTDYGDKEEKIMSREEN